MEAVPARTEQTSTGSYHPEKTVVALLVAPGVEPEAAAESWLERQNYPATRPVPVGKEPQESGCQSERTFLEPISEESHLYGK